jgi:maltose/moltooligosaccharide transporter
MAVSVPTTSAAGAVQKPKLSFLQIWNISFGFLGVQIGYSLQTSNTSGILSAIGADVHKLSYFWLAAPIAGLIVQPIIGLSSDRIWTKLGRRIPFILAGAIVSACAMFFMPNSEHYAQILPPVLFGATMLLLMDTSFNITMQPFRGLVSDMVPETQRNIGYSIQTFLINVGGVVGSLLPAILTWWGMANKPLEGNKVAPTVIWAYYIGGAILLLTVIVTAFTTKEYPPEEYAKYHNLTEEKTKTSFLSLLKNVPSTMLQLAVTQFFSWFALFLMWVYTTNGIAQTVWHCLPSDSTSESFNDARNWTGVLSAIYGVVAALYALFLTPLANRIGRKNIYMISLIFGGIGLFSMMFITNKYILFLPMLGVGIAWASILSMPYAILSSTLPPKQTGVYMGIFNATITIPQIAAGILGGLALSLVGDKAINVIGLAGASMVIAGICAKLVIKSKE